MSQQAGLVSFRWLPSACPFCEFHFICAHIQAAINLLTDVHLCTIFAKLNLKNLYKIAPFSILNTFFYIYFKISASNDSILFVFRFLGSAKILLRDLASGQTRSLPCKNVPLVNESGQNIGVSLINSNTHTKKEPYLLY